MKIKKRTAACLAAAVIIFACAMPARANTYPDVPTDHWSYSAVDKITGMGIMSGNSSGNFEPNSMLDKFETAKILAAVAGFKTQNATQSEKDYYDSCYFSHKGLLDEHAANYAKWNSDVNRQIAYLLEIGVYKEKDLESFVVVRDGAERLYALSREEACVFFSRVLGEEDAARSFVPDRLFNDDANISASAKPYVYYMRYIGVVNGDSDGNFSPNAGIVRAAVAVMLDKVIARMGYAAPSLAGQSSVPASNYQAVTGTITQVYSSFRAVEIMYGSSNDRKIYPVQVTALISVDGVTMPFDSLKAGMNIAGVLINGEITEIAAVSSSVTSVPHVQTTPTPNYSGDSSQNSVVEGTVKTTMSGAGGNYIDILVKLVNIRGEIYEETRSFLLASGCTITRGDYPASFSSIVPGDLVKASISGTTVYSLTLEEKNRTLFGTLIGKRLSETTGAPVMSIQDAGGKINELTVTEFSAFTRYDYDGMLAWRDIRVGDSVEVYAEYDKILTMSASGTRTFIDARITKITITADFSEITAIDEKGIEKVYQVITSLVDVYSLRVGTMVSLGLDSMEVESVVVLQNVETGYFTGFVTDVADGSITVRDASGATFDSRSFIVDANSIIMDSLAGTRVSLASLTEGMKVYIVFDSGAPNYAKTVTILGY